MDKLERYLHPPWPYLYDFASISWSTPLMDALVYEHGETFVLRQPLAEFIDGFCQERELINFGYILHLLDIFLKEKTHRPAICTILRQLMKKPGVSYRNAGLLAAHVTPQVHTTVRPALAAEVYRRLSNPLHLLFNRETASGELDVTAPMEVLYELPTLTALEFENQVCDELNKLTEADLKHWLRMGEQPETQKPVLPVLQSAAWEETMQGSERLRGVAPFLTPLMSALTLPPRRLVSNDLPLGGYADVTNRGRIDALLPTQFALDPDDFIRRFAEQELLYFRREDPVTLPEADLLLILDQGIRTWGSTRLRLTAAALALAMKAQSHGRTVYLTTSSHYREMMDVNSHKHEDLAAVLERSDLTSHPSVALSMLAERTREQTLDVVLLSHPRNVLERSVIVANQAFNTESRLFALTVDEESNACWGEIKHGELTRVQRFHIQAVHRPEARRKQKTGEPVRDLRWTGPVEPFASPFQVPQRYKVVDVDFDTEDHWMFVLDGSGRVSAYAMEEPNQCRVLTRVTEKEEQVTFDGIVGVPGGFVAYLQEKKNDPVFLAHYDMQRRVVQSTRTILITQVSVSSGGAMSSAASTEEYFPELEKLCHQYYTYQEDAVVLTDRKADSFIVYYLQQNIGKRLQRNTQSVALLEQSSNYCRRSDQWYYLPVRHLPHTGTILLKGYSTENTAAEYQPHIPQADGKPVHRDQTLLEAQQGGGVLCLLMQQPKSAGTVLYVYSLPHFHRIGEHSDVNYFKLSASGRYLALRLHPFCVQVLDLQQNNRLVLRTRSGNKVKVRELVAGPGWLHVRYSTRQSNYLIDWRSGVLQCTYRTSHPNEYSQFPVHRSSMVELGYTSNKDMKVHRCHLTLGHRIMADELGHIWVHDLHDNLICVFLLDQTDIAGWMPDGTTFGPARLVGHDSIPDAPRLFAEALRRSSEVRV